MHPAYVVFAGSFRRTAGGGVRIAAGRLRRLSIVAAIAWRWRWQPFQPGGQALQLRKPVRYLPGARGCLAEPLEGCAMPSRVIRAGLLSSEAVAGLADKPFRLYVALLLSADDFGLVEVGYGPIREATALLVDGWSRDSVSRMLGELDQAGLIRRYAVAGKAYAAVARWESYVNSARPKHPPPPWGLTHVRRVIWFKDAATRLKASLFLKHLGIGSGAPVPHQGGTSPPLVKEEVRGKGKEKKKKKAETATSTKPALWPCPPDVDAMAWSDWMAVRQRKHCSQSPRAFAAVSATLQAIRDAGLQPGAAVAQSANAGWADVYVKRANGSAAARPGSHAPTRDAFGAFDTTGTIDATGRAKE